MWGAKLVEIVDDGTVGSEGEDSDAGDNDASSQPEEEKSDGKLQSPARKHGAKTGEARGSETQQADPESDCVEDTGAETKKTGSKQVPATSSTPKAKTPAKATQPTKASDNKIPRKPNVPQAQATQTAIVAGKKQPASKRKTFDSLAAGSIKPGKQVKVTAPINLAVEASGDDAILATATDLFRQMASEIKTPPTGESQEDAPAAVTTAVGKVNIAGLLYGKDKVLDTATDMLRQKRDQEAAAKAATDEATPSSAEKAAESTPAAGNTEALTGQTDVNVMLNHHAYVGDGAGATPSEPP